jgi:hypothetical protein
VELELSDDPSGRAGSAVRAAAVRAGVALAPVPDRRTCAWWRAGLLEGLARDPGAPAPAAANGYDVTPSPRSTRGATRA